MFSKFSGDEYGLFLIDKNTGVITVEGQLDREYYSEFKLRVKAYEVNEIHSFNTIDLRIKLIDVNDNFPMFEQQEYIVNVRQEQAHPQTIISDNIRAADDDATV